MLSRRNTEYTLFEKQFGNRETVEAAIVNTRRTQYEEALTETVKLNQKLNAVEVGVMSPSDSQKELPIAPATEGESEQPEQAETTKEATKEATKEPVKEPVKETKAPAEAAQVSEMQKMPVQTQLEQLLAALKESEWRWRVRSRFEDTHGVGAKATDEESVAAVQTCALPASAGR